MGHPHTLRTSWSVPHTARAATVERANDELWGRCRSICAEHLPASAGYRTRETVLRGPVGGRNLVVVRGDFRAVVSLQQVRYGRDLERRREVRLIASARHDDALGVAQPDPDRALARWSLVGSALGTTSLASMGIASAGAFSSVTLALLCIPALMALRMLHVMRLGTDLTPRALQPSPLERARQEAMARDMARDRRRWKHVLERLSAQREGFALGLAPRPFRPMAGLPWSSLTSARVA